MSLFQWQAQDLLRGRVIAPAPISNDVDGADQTEVGRILNVLENSSDPGDTTAAGDDADLEPAPDGTSPAESEALASGDDAGADPGTGEEEPPPPTESTRRRRRR